MTGEDGGLVGHCKDFAFHSCGLGSLWKMLREESQALIYALINLSGCCVLKESQGKSRDST